MLRHTIICLLACGLALATESFENLPQGAMTDGEVGYGALSAEKGHAEILSGKGKSGQKALRLMGGEDKQVDIVLDEPLAKEAPCDFWLQRWTRAEPFRFTVSAVTAEGTKELCSEAKMGVGGYNKHIQTTLPAGTTAVRFTCTSPDKGGALVDDFAIHSSPMALKSVEAINPGAYPLLKRAPINPAFAIHVQASGSENPLALETVRFKVDSPQAVENITLRSGNAEGTHFRGSVTYGTAKPAADGSVTITCNKPLLHGNNWLWVDVEPSAAAKVGSNITFSNIATRVAGKSYRSPLPPVTQSIGYLLSVPGEKVAQLDGSQRACTAFRIPGIIRTDKGSLVGVFDARYRHAGDLCADIDVAAVRSVDGGQTWTAPAVAMDAGPGVANGCGDPCILQDANGRIWVQALACHFSGGASLWTSKKGFDPMATGQWEMTYSDDDGKTWARSHVNPTNDIKKEEWDCILAGPGNGITLRNGRHKGAIVFPAQIWQKEAPFNCMSTICYSKDGGKTWKYGNGVPHRTSECQVVELNDGSLMLNCRNEARSGKRVVYVTKDFGATWEPHSSNLEALAEPTCQASIISAVVPKPRSTGKTRVLFFSNPKSTKGRNQMTVRASYDQGATWNEGYEYDTRGCWGYSCLVQIDEETLGVIYEVPHVSTTSEHHGIGFLRLPIKKVMGK